VAVDKAEVQQVEENPLPPLHATVRESMVYEKLIT
jgi:hypothetical protein